MKAAKYKQTVKHVVKLLFDFEYKYGYKNDAVIEPNLQIAVSILLLYILYFTQMLMNFLYL